MPRLKLHAAHATDASLRMPLASGHVHKSSKTAFIAACQSHLAPLRDQARQSEIKRDRARQSVAALRRAGLCTWRPADNFADKTGVDLSTTQDHGTHVAGIVGQLPELRNDRTHAHDAVNAAAPPVPSPQARPHLAFRACHLAVFSSMPVSHAPLVACLRPLHPLGASTDNGLGVAGVAGGKPGLPGAQIMTLVVFGASLV